MQVGNKKTPSVQCLMELGDVFRMEKRGKEGDSFAFATVVGGSFKVQVIHENDIRLRCWVKVGRFEYIVILRTILWITSDNVEYLPHHIAQRLSTAVTNKLRRFTTAHEAIVSPLSLKEGGPR